MVMLSDIAVIPEDPRDENLVARAKDTAQRWNLPYSAQQDIGLVLVQSAQQLALRQLDEPKLGAVFVDFGSDALTFRRLRGGGRKEAIAKAVGIKGDNIPNVIDATAGLGRDAFVLASLGCKVDMVERSPVVAALLQDGLERASTDTELSGWLPQKMQLFHQLSYDVLANWQAEPPDVVYLDPMFPHRRKSALVKKDMRLFQQLLGPDEDADKLLAPARQLARHRVVVKRPDSAPHLAATEPSMMIRGKKHRFDVYIKN